MPQLADIDRLFAATVDGFGGIDILVANAGVEQVSQKLVEITKADFDLLFDVNTRARSSRCKGGEVHSRQGRIIYIVPQVLTFNRSHVKSIQTSIPQPQLHSSSGKREGARVHGSA